jgi:predicted methyltransferase
MKKKLTEQKRAGYYIDENQLDKFNAITDLFSMNKSYIINEFIRDFNVKHTAQFNEKLFESQKINEEK